MSQVPRNSSICLITRGRITGVRHQMLTHHGHLWLWVTKLNSTRENTHVLFTPMETRDSILLRIHRLTNDVYFGGTSYNDISVPVKGNLRFELSK
jgi:hypothetical protein